MVPAFRFSRQLVLLLATLMLLFVHSVHAEPHVDDVEPAQAMAHESATERVVLDVRTPAEFKAGHIPGAININVNDENFSNKVSKLPRDKTYLVHCAANVPNGRGARALSTMQSQGFHHLQNLVGGYAGWVAEGGETTMVKPEAIQ